MSSSILIIHSYTAIMDYLIIALLLLAGIILLLTELFLIPGLGITGIIAGGCLVYANYYAFTELGIISGCITLFITIAASIGALVWFMRSKTLDRISLKKNITSQIDRSAEASLKPGYNGITTTRLALIGYADFNGNIVEVKSEGGLIDEGTPIIVTRVANGVVIVKRFENQ